MKTFINLIYYGTLSALFATGVAFVITLAPIPGNYEVKVVKSGSMEPDIQVGGVVVIKPSSSYGVGDVITFGADTKTQIPTTHRIVAVEGEGTAQVYQTKGDANDAPDPEPVKRSEVAGKVIFSVPYLGYLLAFARTPLGFVALVGLPATLVIAEESFAIVRELRRMRARRRKKLEPEESEMQPEPYGRHVALRKSGDMARKNANRFIVGGIVALFAVGGALVPKQFGDTTAQYADTELAQSNRMQASDSYSVSRVFLSLAAPLVLGEQTGPDVSEAEPPVETPEQDAEQPADQTTESEPVVEVSEPVTVIEDPAPAPEPQPEPVPDPESVPTPEPEQPTEPVVTE